MSSEGIILFKDPTMQREFAKVVPRLRFLVKIYASLAWLLYGDAIVITSIYRPTNEASLHAHWRAIDIGILEHGGMRGSELLRSLINMRYPYGRGNDGKIKDSIPELRHGTSPHTHLQCKDEGR